MTVYEWVDVKKEAAWEAWRDAEEGIIEELANKHYRFWVAIQEGLTTEQAGTQVAADAAKE